MPTSSTSPNAPVSAKRSAFVQSSAFGGTAPPLPWLMFRVILRALRSSTSSRPTSAIAGGPVAPPKSAITAVQLRASAGAPGVVGLAALTEATASEPVPTWK